MTLRVRPATTDDVDALVDLYRVAYETAAELGFPTSMLHLDRETVEGWLADGDASVFVGERDGRLVAAVRFLEEREHPYGERLAVHPDERGEGVGTRMREYVERRARESGYERLQIATFADHPFLVDHYREAGYEEFDRWDPDARAYEIVGMETEL